MRYSLGSLLLVCMTSASLGCEVTPFGMSSTARAIRVRSGEACDTPLGTGIGGQRGVTQNISIHVIERPLHGFAGAAGLSSIAYKAAQGYAGPDRFKVEIVRQGNGARYSDFMDVSVEVYR